MPTVSVILNCYNHEAYVAEAIESVLAQTFTDFELLVIDNGSTDATRRVIERYIDPRIRHLFHDSNQSLSKRLNEGVKTAVGDFVAILYSDDYMLPDKLARQLALFRTLPEDYGVVYAPAIGLNQHTRNTWKHPTHALEGHIFHRMLHHPGYIDMSSPLTRRSCLTRYQFHEDLFIDGEAVLFRIAMRYKFKFDPEPTVVLRDHGGNAGKAIQRNTDMALIMLDRLAGHEDFPANAAGDLAAYRALYNRSGAWVMLRLGSDDIGWIRARLREALLAQPQQITHPRTLVALALAAMPRWLRRWANRVGDRITVRPENRRLVDQC